MIFSVRRPQYFISHTKSPRSLVTRHRLSCEKIYKTNTRNVSLGYVWWYASRRTQRSIDRSEDIFVEYPVCVISEIDV